MFFDGRGSAPAFLIFRRRAQIGDFDYGYTGIFRRKIILMHTNISAPHPQNGGTVFRTYAPNAWKAGVCGDFSGWDIVELMKVHDCGVYEVFIPGAFPGMKYTYRIYDKKGNMYEHCDPLWRRNGIPAVLRLDHT